MCYSGVFKPVQEKLKLPALNFQTLRRTAATLAHSAGSVKDVQGLVRHKTADTTTSGLYAAYPESQHETSTCFAGSQVQHTCLR
jgi:integrase